MQLGLFIIRVNFQGSLTQSMAQREESVAWSLNFQDGHDPKTTGSCNFGTISFCLRRREIECVSSDAYTVTQVVLEVNNYTELWKKMLKIEANLPYLIKNYKYIKATVHNERRHTQM